MTIDDLKKAPPQNLEAEQMVLAALMMEPERIDAAYVRTGDFYARRHRAVFDAVRMLRGRGMDVDIVTMAAALKNAPEFPDGAAGYLSQLLAITPTAANFRSHERLVISTAQLREIRQVAQDARARVDEAPDSASADAIVADTITALNAIRRHEGDSIMPYDELMAVGFQEIERRFELAKAGKIAGIPTPFRDLDRKLFGLQPQLYVVSGASGSGKSAFTAQLGRHGAGHFLRQWEETLPEVRAPKPDSVGVISLEMGPQQMALRDISSMSDIPLSRLLAGTVHDPDWARLSGAAAAGSRLPVYLAFSAFNNRQIERVIDDLVQRYGAKLILFDYLQLAEVEGHAGTREQEVTELIRLHKRKIQQHRIPHVIISSLNKGGANRPDKRPINADLRESGNIEFDADVILFVYRDEMYNCKCPRSGACGCGRRGKAEIIISKGRWARWSWNGTRTPRRSGTRRRGRMGEHYTKSTVGIAAWCNTCKRTTMHSVSGKRRGPCTEHGHKGLTKAQKKRREEQARTEREPRLL
jgi:replicative DNA helicase